MSSSRNEMADICFVLEGTYPFVMGGVSGWTHQLIQSLPDKSIELLCVQATKTEALERRYDVPDNVKGLTTIFLDDFKKGPVFSRLPDNCLDDIYASIERLFKTGDAGVFTTLIEGLKDPRVGARSILESKAAWKRILDVGERVTPSTSLLQFFWTWRSLVASLAACLTAPLPRAKVYHSISTGYAGIVGARAALEFGAPYMITEHGIYTNERRIELYSADWLYDTGRSRFSTVSKISELRDLWLSSFVSFARIAYDCADEITTLYTGNQAFQLADGADKNKLIIIPNGVDFDRFSQAANNRPDHPLTVALIGRVVPIKDIRMFISACDVLKQRLPDVEVLIMGPEDEDEEYAAQCHAMVSQLGLDETITFCGRVNISEYLPRVDLVALTSLSEAQPLVLLEAGAAAIPCVSTDVGSCREMVEGYAGDEVKGVGGRIVNCGDARAAGEAMAEILSNSELREQMGRVMQKRVEETYNKVIIDRRYRDFYNYWIAEANTRLQKSAGTDKSSVTVADSEAVPWQA